jgi:hypothetical protein
VPSAPGIGRSRLEASCERVVAGHGPIGDGDLTPSAHSELLAQYVRVRLRRSRGDAETLTDLVVRAPGGYQLDDLALPLRDLWNRVPECFVHKGRS